MGLVGVVQESGDVVAPMAVLGGGSWAGLPLFRARLTATGQLVHDLLGLAGMTDGERGSVVAGLRGER